MGPGEVSADRFYVLGRGIRVRRERFGLLFYDRNGPKLTFVHSGLWMGPELFSGQLTLREWLRSHAMGGSEEKTPDLERKISRLLSRLIDKGLIVEKVAGP